MIFLSIQFFVNRHILLAIGDLRKTEFDEKSKGFGPKWSLAIHSIGSL